MPTLCVCAVDEMVERHSRRGDRRVCTALWCVDEQKKICRRGESLHTDGIAGYTCVSLALRALSLVFNFHSDHIMWFSFLFCYCVCCGFNQLLLLYFIHFFSLAVRCCYCCGSVFRFGLVYCTYTCERFGGMAIKIRRRSSHKK